MDEVARGGGVAVDREEYVLGVMCVAVCVPGLPKALAVSVPARRAAGIVSRTHELRRAARLVSLAHG